MKGGLLAEIDARSGVYPGTEYEQLRLYERDDVLLRVVDAGEIQVIEFQSDDREWPPAHFHPWHEVAYVIEGEVEFEVDGRRTRGGPGTVQLVRQGSAHSLQIPEGVARVLMITVGAPYDGFAREIAALGAEGYPKDVLEIANRHGLRLAE